MEDLKELFGVHGVDINVQDHLGNSGLHYAAHAGHAAAVSLLLHQPSIKINLTNNVGDTPLHKVLHNSSVTICVGCVERLKNCLSRPCGEVMWKR